VRGRRRKKGGGKKKERKTKRRKGEGKKKNKKRKREKGKRKEKGFRKLGEILGKLGEGKKRIFGGIFPGFATSGDFLLSVVMAKRVGQRGRGWPGIPGEVADRGGVV
jgi:hypothetical protein